MERRLAAILAADLVGYSRLMEADEAGTLARLKALREDFINPAVAAHRGRVVKLIGDGTLVEFADPVDAVAFALTLQKRLAERAGADASPAQLRIGINYDTVIVEDGDIYGDGVNVAARLEGMADPGGILMAHAVRDRVAGHVDAEFFDNGERKFKNISRPIRVWSWPRKLPSLRAAGKPRLFVAGFGSGTGDSRLAADLGDELHANLARLTGVEVALGRADAHYVIEGDVRRAANRLRISSRLVAVEGDRLIWSDRYDSDADEPLGAVDQCAARIAMSVRRRLVADDAMRLAGRPLDELSLEELLVAAGVSFYTPTKAGWRGGGEMAEQALELAPHSFMALAMAAAGLGLAEPLYGFRKAEDGTTDLAFQRINEALRLNNLSDMLHMSHAGLLLYGRGRHRDAEAAARQALELNPGYNMGLWMLGAAQVFAGQSDAGARAASRAVEIDVRDPYVHLYSRVVAYGHLGAERPGAAADWFRRADLLAPGLPHNLMGLAVAAHLDGDAASARNAAERLVREVPEFRLSEVYPPPFRDQRIWPRYVETLRAAGAPA